MPKKTSQFRKKKKYRTGKKKQGKGLITRLFSYKKKTKTKTCNIKK